MKSGREIQDLFERLGHLTRSNIRQFAYSEGMNLRQLESLFYLSKCNRYSDTPLALAEYLGLTKGTVSQTVISLEKKSLLNKIRDKQDGRILHLHLTTKAQKLVHRCISSSHIIQSLESSPQITEPLSQLLLDLLKTIQLTHKSQTFAVCHSCSFFRQNGLRNSHQCGLTKEPLQDDESFKICREHTFAGHSD